MSVKKCLPLTIVILLTAMLVPVQGLGAEEGMISNVDEEDEALVFIDEEQVVFEDVSPYITETENVLVPLRFICDNVDAEVNWNCETREITLTNSENIMVFEVESEEYKLNGETRELETYPEIIDGRSKIPMQEMLDGFVEDVVLRDHEGLILVFAFTEPKDEDVKQSYIDEVKSALDQYIEKNDLELGSSKREQQSISESGFLFPVETSKGQITSPYGPRWGGFHRGVDFSASHGTPIMAAADGEVTYSGWRSGYGNLIIIAHSDGYQTYYAHNSDNLVSEGEWVEQGQVIATMGATGYATGAHVHFEIHRNGNHTNPLKYFDKF